MSLPLSAPIVLTAHPIPLVFDKMTRPGCLEVIDRVEMDQREGALRRVRAGLLLELAPLHEQLGPLWLAEQEPRPHS